MADQGEENQSQFNARADNAALALRQSLQQQGRQVADQAPVEVGPDGRPPAPLPPEGSYVRQALDQQRAEAPDTPGQAWEDMQRQGVEMRPDEAPMRVGEVEPAQKPPPAPAPQETPEEQISGNAQRRIQELVEELRKKDQELQQVSAQGQQQGATLSELQAKLESLQKQHEQLIQSNLDHLDPETRMQVMQDARIQEALAGLENRIMGQILPHIQKIDRTNVESAMEKLGRKYPRFDVGVHGPLIEMFRGKNPACTVEQAFRAIAEPEELQMREAASAAVVPPVVPPGNRMAAPRFAPQAEAQKDENQELVEEAQLVKKLLASADPSDQRKGHQLMHEHLKRRLQ